MARKKPARPAARKATRKAAARPVSRRTVKTAVKTAAKKAGKTVKKAARKAAGVTAAASRKATKIVKKAKRSAAGIKAGAIRLANKATRQVSNAVVTAKAVKAGGTAAVKRPKTPNLDRPRKTVADVRGLPSSLGEASLSSAARSGRSDLKHKLQEHTSSSPALTAGDVDADWASADSSGDEAPGGDNPTPDQDVVDEIGRALGVEYADDEELQGGAEIADRDRHRWELDPSSKDDFEDTE